MLGRTFESPNAIDAGEAPPLHPGRRMRGRRGSGPTKGATRSPRSVARVRIQERLVNDERLFRGTRIKIESDNHSQGSDGISSIGGDDDEENPSPIRRTRRTNSFEDDESPLHLEVYDGDEEGESSPHDHPFAVTATATKKLWRPCRKISETMSAF